MMTSDFTECYAVPNSGSIIDGINPATGLTFVCGETAEQITARYPDAVRMNMDDWMAAKAARQQTPISWLPTTAEQYEDMLGVLPPIDWNRGAFLVGEADDHCCTTGRPRYRAYRQVNDAYFVSSRPLTRAELKAVVA